MSGARVLIVEDNEMNMKLFRDVLAASGFRTLEARTGARAVELARAQQPDVVLMFVLRPYPDGGVDLRSTCGEAPTSTLPVVAVTAQAMDGDRERFLHEGFDAYVSKPVDVVALVGTVREHCAEARGRGSRPGSPAASS